MVESYRWIDIVLSIGLVEMDNSLRHAESTAMFISIMHTQKHE